VSEVCTGRAVTNLAKSLRTAVGAYEHPFEQLHGLLALQDSAGDALASIDPDRQVMSAECQSHKQKGPPEAGLFPSKSLTLVGWVEAVASPHPPQNRTCRLNRIRLKPHYEAPA
jgi:hypothetical protein